MDARLRRRPRARTRRPAPGLLRRRTVGPVERWNERAALEPNLGPCQRTPTGGTLFEPAPRSVDVTGRASSEPAAGCSPTLHLAALAARSAVLVLAALASAYVLAVGAWLWSLRDGISGADVSSGLLLVGVAVLLAWVAGVMGAGWRPTALSPPPTRTWPDLAIALLHLTGDRSASCALASRFSSPASRCW
jgi:hypothetical protein